MTIEYAFQGILRLIEAMKDKDADLYYEVGSLAVLDAMEKWVEKYPEDFPERGRSSPDANCIKLAIPSHS